MSRWRRAEGQTSAEYLGVIAFVVAVGLILLTAAPSIGETEP
jgi:hypothetical protein